MLENVLLSESNKSNEAANLACYLIIFLCLLGFLGAFVTGFTYRMDSVIHARLSFYALPAAISWLYHGAAFDHSLYAQIADLFFTTHPKITDSVIAKAIHFPNFDHSSVLLFPADDKGAYELSILSLAIFGPHVASLYYGTFLLLALSTACFIVEFWREPKILALAVLYMFSLWACISAFAITKELYSISNPRVFGVLCIIPFLHLTLSIGRQARWQSIVLCMLQILVLLECLQIRSTEVWVFVGFAIVMLLSFHGGHSVKRAWPMGLAFLGLLVLLPLYQVATYNQDYFNTNTRGRLFWHNVGIGFALHPKLAKQYNLTFSDNFWNLVHKKALDEGGSELVMRVFGNRTAPEWTGIAEDAVEYERLARAVIFDFAKNNPKETIELFAIYKPALFVRTVLWWLGWYPDRYDRLYIDDQIDSLATPVQRKNADIYWRPLFFPVILASIFLAWLGISELPFLPVIMAFMFSMIAPIVVYPAVHTLAVPILTLTMLSQMGLMMLFAWLSRLRHKYR